MARKKKIPAVRLTIDNDQSNQNSNEQIDNYLPLNDYGTAVVDSGINAPTLEFLGGKDLAKPKAPEKETFWATQGAQWRQENFFASLIPYEWPEDLKNNPEEILEGFNPLDYTQGYEDYQDDFVGLSNKVEVDRLKYVIDKERQDRAIIANSTGWANLVSGMVAGTVSPINLLPIGAAYRSLSAGNSILRTGLATAATNATSQALEEVVLRNTQATRTNEESMMNIAGATLLGGVLGAGASAISKTYFNKLSKQLEKDMTIPRDGENYLGGDKIVITKAELDADTDVMRSVGAKSSMTEAKLKSALGAEKLAVTPGMRLATSKNVASRQAGQQLVDTGLLYEGNALGIETPMPVSTLVEFNRNKDLSSFSFNTENLYKSYLKTQKNLPAEQRYQLTDNMGVPIKDNLLSQQTFNMEITRAVKDKGHAVKEIADAAKDFKKYLDKWRDENIAAGNLPETAVRDDYIPHYYDKEKIIADREGFIGILETEIKTRNPNTALEASEINAIANDVMFQIMHGDPTQIALKGFSIPETRGSLKTRTLDLPNDMAFNFIETDAEKILRRYFDQMIPDAVLKNTVGDTTGIGLKLKISDQYRSDISKLRSESPKTTEARNVLLKELDDNRTKLLSENGANKSEIEAQYLKEKRFIETSSPQEVIARRKSIERLNKRYENKIKKAFDKELNSRLKKIAGAFEKQGKSVSSLNKMYSQQEKMAKLFTSRDKTVIKGKFASKLEKINREKIRSIDEVTNQKTSMQRALDRADASKEARLKALDSNLPEYKDLVKQIESDHSVQITNLMAGSSSSKDIKKLMKQYQQDIIDVDVLVSMIKNKGNVRADNILNSGITGDIIKTAKTLNFARSLGQVSITSITDIGSIIFAHGLNKAFGAVFSGLVGGIARKISPESSLGKLSKANLDELKSMGFVTEAYLNNRFNSLQDLSREYTTTFAKKANDKISNIASKASLINYTYDFLRATGVRASADRIIKSKLSPKDIEILASYGLNADMVKRIQSQHKAFGQGRNLGIDKWTDREAAVMMQLGLQRMTDNAVINPKYELPNFFHTELGSLMGQFKRWSIAATQRILMSGLQRRDYEVIQGIVAMTGLGMMSTMIKEIIKNGEIKERSTEEWIKIGVDRSGVLGYLPDLYGMANELTLGGIGRGLGLEGKDEYHSVEKTLQQFSPTFGLVSNITKALPIFWSDKKTSAQTYAFRSLWPLQNSLLLSKGFDWIEDSFREHYGIKARGQSSRSVIK